jgi:hypothetical protein
VRLAEGGAVVADDALPPPPARLVRVVLLAAPDRAADAGFLRAALAAAAEDAAIAMELTSPGGGGAERGATAVALAKDPAPALVFWLADAPPPARLLAAARTGARLVSDAGTPEEACGGTLVAAPAAAPVAMRRCAATQDAATSPASHRAAVLWRTEGGRAILVAQPHGRGLWLRFSSRFHPAWSELVLSAAFPEWLRGLLMEAAGGTRSAEVAASDRRGDGGQGAPAVAAASAGSAATPPASRWPERALYLWLFTLLLAERWLANRR